MEVPAGPEMRAWELQVRNEWLQNLQICKFDPPTVNGEFGEEGGLYPSFPEAILRGAYPRISDP